MNEDTIIKSMDLPAELDRDWEFFADLNVLALRRGLDCDGKLAAIDDMQRVWRRQHLTVVRSTGAAAFGIAAAAVAVKCALPLSVLVTAFT